MRWLAALSLVVSVSACAMTPPEPTGQRFPVFFAPMVSTLGNGGDQVVASAAKFAERYPDKPVTLVAYAAPPGHHYVEPADIDTLRATAVTKLLISDGVSAGRIAAVAKGPVQPNVPMSKIEVRRVDIIVGEPPQGQ
ncbi:OmpA family protein [Acidisoma sp. C75]